MYKIILIFHILCGASALLSGLTAIISKKGGNIHKKSGIIYYFGMYGVAATSVVLTLMKFNPFLLSIGLFAFYLTWSGKKSIDYWRLKEDYTPSMNDKIPVWIGFFTAIFMIGFPFYQSMILGQKFFPVLTVFGSILFMNTFSDLKKLNNVALFTPKNRMWLISHIGKMGGAFISTTTAFILNNFSFNPQWLGWLLPTFIGVPLIFMAVRKWKLKLRIS